MLTLAATPWQPFKSVQEQSLINEPGFSLATHPVKAQYVHAYSEAGHREVRDSFVKKGSSRTGARRVRNLSAAQLDRKRAHDREAQRMIRQRRKDHIDSLERTMSALRHSNQANISMMEKIQRQNWQLEEENAHLRRELGDANHQRNLQPHKCRSDASLLAGKQSYVNVPDQIRAHTKRISLLRARHLPRRLKHQSTYLCLSWVRAVEFYL